MKRDDVSGSDNIVAPATSAFNGNRYITQKVITHNLGKIPFFTISYEPFGDGVIWGPLGTRSQGSATNPRDTSQTGPYLLATPTSTTLTIELGYTSNSLTGTYPIYWVIYKDYEIA